MLCDDACSRGTAKTVAHAGYGWQPRADIPHSPHTHAAHHTKNVHSDSSPPLTHYCTNNATAPDFHWVQ
jgi:hypothetical protein